MFGLVASAVLMPIACCGVFLVYADGYDTIAVIDCGSRREIRLSVPRSWEVSQPIFYSVTVDDEVVTPRTVVGTVGFEENPYEIKFRKFTDASENRVGIAFRDDGDNYLIVHDFRTNHSWPSAEHFPFDPKVLRGESQNSR